jgi:cytochrome c oxidase assembly protein subunit 15
MFLAVLQGGIGYVQYFNNVPAVLVAAHVAGATALWVATIWLILAGLQPSTDHVGQVHAPETDRTVGESLPVMNIP